VTRETAVSFDLFGTLVRVGGPANPATAVARALERRGVTVPDGWECAYREQHIAVESGAEVSLPAHVAAALRSRGVDADAEVVLAAVRAAFEPEVQTVPDARQLVADCATAGAVGICSNCSVPGLVAETLARSSLDEEQFDAVVASVAVGRRKPDSRIFEAVADALDCTPATLVHVGDNPETDGGVESVGGRFVSVDERLPSTDRVLEVSA